jgi:hypothetical protein
MSQLRGREWIEASFHFATIEGYLKGFIERAGVDAWKAPYMTESGEFKQERQQYLSERAK